LGATALSGNLRKSASTWLKLSAIWSYRLGDIGQTVQHVQAETVSAASEKWLQLACYLVGMTVASIIFIIAARKPQ